MVNEVPLPPDNGVRIVSHHAMQLMASCGHTLALAVLTQEDDRVNERFQRIAMLCQSGMSFLQQLPKRSKLSIFVTALLNLRLYFIERYRCKAFRVSLAKLIVEFRPDVIHFDIITMTQYRDLAPEGVGTIASINDSNALTLANQLRVCHHRGLARVYRYIQYWQSRYYERTCYTKFDGVHVMSQVDASFLQKLNSAIRTHVVANGVSSELLSLRRRTLGLTDVVFVAKLAADNLVNLAKFLTISWPIVKVAYPDVKLSVTGKLTSEAESFRAETEAARGVVFTGYVPDLIDVYRGNGIAIVPIDKDCGIINNALEAMAAGLAVVGFKNSFAGIVGAVSRVNCVAVEDYQSFGHAIVQLIADDDLRCRIQQQASLLIEDKHTWQMRSEAYGKMYEDAMNSAEHKAGTKKTTI